MAFVDQSLLVGWKSMNGFISPDDSKGITVRLDFSETGSNGDPWEIDLALVEMESRLAFVQTIAVNNLSGGAAFTIVSQVADHELTIAAGKQAILPIFSPSTAKFLATIAESEEDLGIVKIHFLNFPLPALVW